jgi:hypothetical protein
MVGEGWPTAALGLGRARHFQQLEEMPDKLSRPESSVHLPLQNWGTSLAALLLEQYTIKSG